MALLLTVVLFSWANYSETEAEGYTTLTWDFAEYASETVTNPDNVDYNGLIIKGNSDNETLTKNGFKINGTTTNGGRYIAYTPTYSGTVTITAKANGSSKSRYVFITTSQGKPSAAPVVGGDIIAVSKDLNGTDEDKATFSAELNEGTTYYFEAYEGVTIQKVVYRYATPVLTDPKLTVSPDEITLSLTPTVHEKSATFKLTGKNLTDGTYDLTVPNLAGLTVAPASFTVADGTVDQEFTVTYASTADVAKATTQIKAVVGELEAVVTVSYQSIATLDLQADVTDDATWDWSKFGTNEIKLDANTKPAKEEEFVLSNVVAYGLCDAVGADFGNAQQLMVSGEYVVRDGKYFQGSTIKFNTTVPGKLSVTYTNTGNRSDEAQRRFLNVNGTNVGEGSMRSDTDVTTEDIDVEAGEVILKGKFSVEADANQADQYLRFKKVVFVAAEAPAPTGETVLFDFEANEWNHAVTVQLGDDQNAGNITEPVVKEGISLLCKQGSASALPRFYRTMAAESKPYLRVLKGAIFKIYAPADKAIAKVEFTYNGTALNLSSDGLTDNVWEGNATYAKFKASATAQIKAFVVTLIDADGETVTPAEADETVFLDIDDGLIHPEFMLDNSEIVYLDSDLELVDGHRDSSDKIDGENLVTTIFPASDAEASSRNRLQRSTRSSVYTTSFRIWNGTMTFKTDADKVIKSIKMDIGNNFGGKSLNGKSITKDELKDGVEVNANTAELTIEGTSATIIYSITYVIGDKPAAAPEPEPTSIDLTVDGTITDGEAYYTTLSSAYALDFTNVEGITAYTGVKNIAGNGANNLKLTEIDKIPAGTGVLIKAAEAKTYTIPFAQGDVEAPEANDLIAALETVSTSTLTNAYTLTFSTLNESLIFESHDNADVDIPAGSAYLSLTADEHNSALGIVTVKFPAGPAVVLANIAALKASAAENVVLTLNNTKLTCVTAQGTAVIEDESGATPISGAADLVANLGKTFNGTLGLEAGFNGYYSVTDLSGMTAVSADPVEPMAITDANLSDYRSNYDWRYVKFIMATYTVETKAIAIQELGGTEYPVQDMLGVGVEMPDKNSTLNVEGFLYDLDLTAFGGTLGTYFQPAKVTIVETTGIDTVKSADAPAKVFNLNGQRVAQPVKGLNIMGGKKVMVK